MNENESQMPDWYDPKSAEHNNLAFERLMAARRDAEAKLAEAELAQAEFQRQLQIVRTANVVNAAENVLQNRDNTFADLSRAVDAVFESDLAFAIDAIFESDSHTPDTPQAA